MDNSNHRLLWETVAPGRPFHAALLTPRAATTRVHIHDFHEMMWVEEGAGTHRINGQLERLTAGDLLFVRPDDAHAFAVRPGQNLHFINIAFRSDLWGTFAALAGVSTDYPEWETAPMPPHMHLSPTGRAQAVKVFGRALRAFHAVEGQLELCRFWSETTRLLRPAKEATAPLLDARAPLWLARAYQLMAQEEHLRAGLPCLLDLCGVSEAHLSRTLKAACGLTPTAWIAKQRLERAATLLATTPLPILDIALDCGFENLSYFYRRFGQKYGQPPRAYRVAARGRIVPEGE